MEPGYNYLAAARDDKPITEQGKKRRQFEDALRETLNEQKIVTGPNEFQKIAQDTLQKISDDFGIPMPSLSR